jgi:hypothetical protein
MEKNESGFVITNEFMKQEYNVTMDGVLATGSIERQGEQVTTINGMVFEKTAEGTQGNYIGNFNGRMVDGQMKYSFSEMNHEQAELVWGVIGVIEANIFNAE